MSLAPVSCYKIYSNHIQFYVWNLLQKFSEEPHSPTSNFIVLRESCHKLPTTPYICPSSDTQNRGTYRHHYLITNTQDHMILVQPTPVAWSPHDLLATLSHVARYFTDLYILSITNHSSAALIHQQITTALPRPSISGLFISDVRTRLCPWCWLSWMGQCGRYSFSVRMRVSFR